MTKITYLLGAGASFNALPIVSDIPLSLINIKHTLANSKLDLSPTEKFNVESVYTKKQIKDFFLQDLQWLIEESMNHASIDTYAKKLYLKKQFTELHRLKVAFSAYLTLAQSIQPADNRYDSFYASILSDSCYTLPQNVRVLSWNYDLQLEKAYSEYSDDKSVSQNQKHLNIYSKYNNIISNTNKFSVFKLNGSCTIIGKNAQHHGYSNAFSNKITLQFLEEVLRNYCLLRFENSEYKVGLSFAWESYSSSSSDSIINLSKDATSDTSILIVIGYSFPYFNREVDRDIINNMKNLSKVYFQSPDAKNISERFLSIVPESKNIQLILRENVNQFLLPNEL